MKNNKLEKLLRELERRINGKDGNIAKKDKKNKENLPAVRNPMKDLMKKSMADLPDLFENANPIKIPRASFNQSGVSLFFGNVKRGQIEKSTRFEAVIAENSLRTIKAKQGALFEAITFGSKVEDHFALIRHNTIMREFEIQERQADVYIKQAQARQAGYEAQLSELDVKMRLKQAKEMDEDETIDAEEE